MKWTARVKAVRIGAVQFGALGPPAALLRKFSGRSMVGIKTRLWGSKAWISPGSSLGALGAGEVDGGVS